MSRPQICRITMRHLAAATCRGPCGYAEIEFLHALTNQTNSEKMKKYQIFMMGAMALGFTACEDAPADAPIQNTPQPPVVAADEVAIVADAVLTSGENLNLDQYIDQTGMPLFSISKDNLPEGLTLSADMQVSATEDFVEIQTLPLTLNGTNLEVDPALWHEAHLEMFGDDFDAQKAYYRVPAYVTTETQAGVPGLTYRLGGVDHYLASGSVMEIPMTSIMTTDYWYTPGDSNGWSAAASQYLYNTNKGDKPWYYGSCLLNSKFKIADTIDWSGRNFGSGGEGVLTDDGAAGDITVAAPGLYWVTANFTALTYTLTAIEKVSIIGNFGGWNTDQYLTPNEDMTVWTGTVELDGEWKIRINENWDYNYGGRLASPVLDGSNFKHDAGTYNVTMTFSGHHPKIKVAKA